MNARRCARASSSTSACRRHWTQWIRRHYRDRLAPADLADPALLDESRRALDELSQLLEIGSVYAFQRDAD